jgi:NAD(P)H-dependent nitrite reductase small subunit
MAMTRVAALADVPEGEGKVVSAGGREIAVFRFGGEVHAIDNLCPHRGGPLGDGVLIGSAVVCPWHGWQFDCATGRSTVNPEVCVVRYPVRVDGDEVFVDPEPA